MWEIVWALFSRILPREIHDRNSSPAIEVAHTSEASSPQQDSHSLKLPAKLRISDTQSILQDDLDNDAIVSSLPHAHERESVPFASSPVAHVTEPPKQDSPFLRLPAELRIMIYDLAIQDNLDNPGLIEPEDGNYLGRMRFKNPMFAPFTGALALLQTNRKLREEGFDAIPPLANARYKERYEAYKLRWNNPASQESQFGAFDETSLLLDLLDIASNFRHLLSDLEIMDLVCRPLDLGPDSMWDHLLEDEDHLSQTKEAYLHMSLEEQELLEHVIVSCKGDNDWEALVRYCDAVEESRKGKA